MRITFGTAAITPLPVPKPSPKERFVPDWLPTGDAVVKCPDEPTSSFADPKNDSFCTDWGMPTGATA